MFAKGRRGTDGYLEYNDPIRFMGPVQFSNPWRKPLFVDAVSGADGASGFSPAAAKKTIQAGVTAGARGDAIYIRPQLYTLGTGFARYTEDVIVPLLTNDLSIIGVTNTLNPEFGVRWKPSGNTTPLTVNAPGLHLENIGFFSEVAYRMIKLENDGNATKVGSCGFTMFNCAVKGNTIQIDSGDGVRLRKVYFHAMYDGSLTGGIIGVTTGGSALRRLTIEDCFFFGGNGVAAATAFITLTGGTITETAITRCNFGAVPQSGKYILNTNVTGGILSNSFFGKAALSRTADLTLSGMIMAGCFDGSGAFVA